jgi:hypothetical protein
LAGREADVTSFATLTARAEAGRSSQSLVLTGLRGVGKTVLLNELAERARDHDWIVAQVEARPDGEPTGSSLRPMVARSLNQSLRQVTGSWGIGDRFRAALATFKSFSIRTDPGGGLALGIDIDPRRGRADSGSLEMDLSELAFDLGASASDRGTGVVVFVDEMQELSSSELAALCTAVHEAGQRAVPFYVIGAGLPSLPGLLAEARSYAERLFDYRPIGPLAGPDAEIAVVRPAALQGVVWAAEAVEAIVDTSAGYPYFLQEFAKATWDYASGPAVDAGDATLGIRVGRDKLDSGFFASRWNRATPGERDYLRAMAVSGERPAISGEVARRLGKRTVQQVGPIRARLIHKGLVYAPERGLVAYTVPGMADFINRQVD